MSGAARNATDTRGRAGKSSPHPRRGSTSGLQDSVRDGAQVFYLYGLRDTLVRVIIFHAKGMLVNDTQRVIFVLTTLAVALTLLFPYSDWEAPPTQRHFHEFNRTTHGKIDTLHGPRGDIIEGYAGFWLERHVHWRFVMTQLGVVLLLGSALYVACGRTKREGGD